LRVLPGIGSLDFETAANEELECCRNSVCGPELLVLAFADRREAKASDRAGQQRIDTGRGAMWSGFRRVVVEQQNSRSAATNRLV
jgi:hypothetical protein